MCNGRHGGEEREREKRKAQLRRRGREESERKRKTAQTDEETKKREIKGFLIQFKEPIPYLRQGVLNGDKVSTLSGCQRNNNRSYFTLCKDSTAGLTSKYYINTLY